MPPSTVDNAQTAEDAEKMSEQAPTTHHTKRNILVVVVALAVVSSLTFAGLLIFVKKTTVPASVATVAQKRENQQPAKGSLKAVDTLISQDMNDESMTADKTESDSSASLSDSLQATQGLEEEYGDF